jgi:menaquinone-dependent protoporphyrinogen oxidase
MTKKILVAYASVSGSTREVAQAIAEVLAGDGVSVEVQPVNTIMSVADYGAIVLGSSIRVGKWLPEAIDFLEDYQESMAHIPVAYFTTCLTMVNDTKDNRRTVLAYMEPVRHQSPEIEPVGLGLFAGSLDPQRQLFMQVEGPQGDYRDWEAIRAWAAEIRPKLLADYVEPGEPPVLRGAVLSYTDMSGLDLREADLQAADLHQADLQEADLHQASLNWADMNWADMAQANLDKANLIGANLKIFARRRSGFALSSSSV